MVTCRDISIDKQGCLEDITSLCYNTFKYDRFHRDPYIDQTLADHRYLRWLTELFSQNNVYFLRYQQNIVGFIAHLGSKLVLHALSESIRGLGFAKYFWAQVSKQLFTDGFLEVGSSVSLTNLAVMNLYNSLEFRYRNPIEIYHRITK